MRQFDIVENANADSGQHVPYLLILQAPLFDDLATRVQVYFSGQQTPDQSSTGFVLNLVKDRGEPQSNRPGSPASGAGCRLAL